MNEQDAKKLVRGYARNGWLRYTKHCRERMSQRRANTDDVNNVLFWGEVRELGFNQAHGDWECLVVGRDIEGDPLTVSLAILEADGALVLKTVHG